ncbi:tRNA pseudouridine synthase B [Nitrospira sp. KM1]|nr:tRNA pseudouridine synthase B [Nitrospira sp. KM1]
MDGVLIVHKEAGWTSHDVVAKLRSVLGVSKVGHAGTLDPAATGVLPVLTGRGTRIAEYLVEWDKEYRAVLRLGETTDTQDATGMVLSRHLAGHITGPEIEHALERFRGVIQQVPPMYSALKVDGVPLYRSARAGKTIVREARSITVSHLDLLSFDGTDATLRVVCSKGTYVRTLCADIGEILGVGGHLLALERSRVGPLTLDHAMSVEEIARRQALGILSHTMLSLDRALNEFPVLVVNGQTAARVRNGVSVPFADVLNRETATDCTPRQDSIVRIHDEGGTLLAIGRGPDRSGAVYAIEKVLVDRDHGSVSRREL